MKINIFIVAIVCLSSSLFSAFATTLNNDIENYLKGKKATVGVAVQSSDATIVAEHNSNLKFPLLSVFKYHIALAVLDKIDKEGTELDKIIHVKASQMHENTYSPLRMLYPNKDINITLGELLEYSVSKSDNNACDILIDFVGGAQQVDSYVRNLGLSNFKISVTEDEMHQNEDNAYLNWSTPLDMVYLLKIADDRALFSQKYKDFLYRITVETSTGTNKIKGELPAETVVGHKTGSSGRNAEGMKVADNDAGFVVMPNGKRYYIATFITQSMESDDENAKIIARISKMVYDYMIATNK